MATNPRAFVLIILVFFLFFGSDSQGPQLPQRFRLDDIVQNEYAALKVLNHSSYGDFDTNRWLNITGFRKDDGFAWNALEAVKARFLRKVEGIMGAEVAKQALNGQLEEKLPLYRNVSGFARGSWVKSQALQNISAPTLNRTASGLNVTGTHGLQTFQRNITGQSGAMRIHVDERDLEFLQEYQGAKEAKMSLTIHDQSSSGEGWELTMHGVHFVDIGMMVFTTTSEKFGGMFGLPHLMLSNDTFDRAMHLLNDTLRTVIEEQQSSSNRVITNPWTSTIDGNTEGVFSQPKCEYIAYIQQHPLNMPQSTKDASVVQHPLEDVEKELRTPTGYIHSPPPSMKMELILFSPDCAFALESKGPPDYAPTDAQHLLGPKIEVITNTGRYLSILYGTVLCGQIYLAVTQMKEASTPSTRSRISFYAIAVLSMGDGFTAMAFLPLGMFIASTFLNFLAVSFFAFLSVTFLDLRFLMDIWLVQDEERRRQERQAHNQTRITAPPASTQTSQTVPSTQEEVPSVIAPAVSGENQAITDTLPLPVSATQAISAGATPIILPPDQDEPANAETPTTNDNPTRRFGALYTRFYAILLIIVFLSLHATSWPLVLRSAYCNLLAFLYLSPWVPQIYRNIMRNCRKALLWKYVVGQSILRLIPVAYFYGVYDNVLFVENDRRALLVLAAWIWIQSWVLFIQSILGPRVFIKKSWVPPAYDYHPVLREDEEASLLPIGFSQATATDLSTSPTSSPRSRRPSGADAERADHKDRRIYDCAICMQDVDVPIVPIGGSESAVNMPSNLLARLAYMVTPCRHIFHTACLESWMRYRLQCPVCRETLPPL